MMDSTKDGSLPLSEKAQARPSRWTRKRKMAVAVAATAVLCVTGLAVGLGVGLTRDSGNDNDDGDEASSARDEMKRNVTGWTPKAGATWQIILKNPMSMPADGTLTPDVAVYDLDMYDNPASTFDTLHAAGKHVVCYFSAGSWEDWRTDAGDFADADLGSRLDGWPRERWLKVSSPGVREIMKKRLQMAADKGCDAVDPDNVDGYENDNGLGLTTDDAIDYMRFLATEARALNMGIGLKNAGDIVDDLVGEVDFAVNEQCIEYAECETFAPFIDAGKPVFNIEYPELTDAGEVPAAKKSLICSTEGDAADSDGFSKAIKNMDLDEWVEYCS